MVRELTDPTALSQITSGYILNFYNSPSGTVDNRIHPFDCPHIGQMSMNYRKVWGETPEELEAWLRQQGGALDPSTPKCQYVV